MRYLSVKNWDRFQHYKDRDPPWIKLYRDTFTTESWVLGTDLSRLLQLASTMLAARYGNKIPLNFRMVAKVASLDCGESEFMAAVAHLVDHNFLEIHEDIDPRKTSASALLAKCSSERETEERREEGEERRTELSASPTDVPRGTVADGDQTGQIVARVFSHWRDTWNHPRAKLDAKRRQRIREALKLGYSEADLCQCISGYRNSPHHMGRNERNTVFDDLELFLRDAKHIDAGLKFYAEPPRRELSEKTLRIVDQTDGWVPPELRMNA